MSSYLGEQRFVSAVSGEEVENYLLSNDLVKPTDIAAGVATNAGCSDDEHAKMATKTIRFF